MAAVVLAACGSDRPTTVATETPRSDRPADAADVSCDDIPLFASTIADTGITYDYEPSQSPAQMTALADAVFGGELTGHVSSTEMLSPDDPNPWTFIGFEIEVTRIVKGTEGVNVGEIVEVFVEYASPTALHLFTGDRTLADPGTPVVVFAGHHPELGELTAFIPEGFMTACPDGRLIGHAGTKGEWADMDGLQAVLNAAEAATPTTSDPPMTPTTVEDPTATTDPTTAPSPPGSTVLPARPATVTGTVGADDDGRPGVLDDASDWYYAGMGLHRGDPYVVDASTGQTVALESLREGERISVWIDGGCAESFPVQCDVTAIGVHRGD